MLEEKGKTKKSFLKIGGIEPPTFCMLSRHSTN